jgi:type I restriction enzyme S subunit
MYDIKYGNRNPTHETDELHPCMSGGSRITKYTNQWNIPENTITIARSGSCGHVSMLSEKIMMGSYGFSLHVKDMHNNINRYIYHILKASQKDIESMALGATVKNINRDMLYGHKFYVPPPEVQQEILARIEPKEQLIASLQHNIDNAEEEAKAIMDVLFN